MCRLPVHGLASSTERVVYLSSHNVSGWGLSVVNQSHVSEKDVFRLALVHKESIAAIHGLRRDQYVRLFKTRDSTVTSLPEVHLLLSEAYRKKRLLKIEIVERADNSMRDCCARLCRLVIQAN
jgi:predicted butyrate kinase (DUF1464 family)